jgi:hypothetical protein
MGVADSETAADEIWAAAPSLGQPLRQPLCDSLWGWPMSIPVAATRFFAEARELLIRAGGNPQMYWVDDWESSFEAV